MSVTVPADYQYKITNAIIALQVRVPHVQHIACICLLMQVSACWLYMEASRIAQAWIKHG